MLNILNIETLCNVARQTFFKFPEDDTEKSKHVGVNIT